MIVEGMMKLHIREIAEARGIKSAKALSERAGIPYASVHRIWNESVTMLALDTIGKLCKALNVQPGMLMSWIDTDALDSDGGAQDKGKKHGSSPPRFGKGESRKARAASEPKAKRKE
jgi:DNA-binding Xre family transcriptional regulator